MRISPSQSIQNMLEIEGSLPRRKYVVTSHQGIVTDLTRRFRERVFAIPYSDDETELGPLVLLTLVQPGANFSSTLASRSTVLSAAEHPVNFPLIVVREDDGTLEQLINGNHAFDNNTQYQGVYREMRAICPDEEDMLTPPVSSDSAYYIVLAYNQPRDSAFAQVMVESWKDWSGARYIYLYLPDELGLASIRLYLRQAPRYSTEPFNYVILVECRAVDTASKKTKLLDFAQRLKVQKMNGYVAVYKLSNHLTQIY